MWNYIYHNELYHHGIKGQKWGVRRTPEQLGHRKKSETDKSTTKEKAKKVAKVGAYVAGTVAVSYAGVKFATSPKVRNAVGKAMDKIGKKKVKETAKSMDSLSGIYSKKLGREFTVAEAIDAGLSDLL